MGRDVAKKLLEKLDALPKRHDPLVDHSDPLEMYEKVVFVPASLADDLKAFLKTLT